MVILNYILKCKKPGCIKKFVQRNLDHSFCSAKCRQEFYNSLETTKTQKREFNKTKKGKEGKKRCNAKYPEKNRARSFAHLYIRGGTCSKKGCEEKGEKHHSDYTKKLKVILLCRKHHVELHNKRDKLIKLYSKRLNKS